MARDDLEVLVVGGATGAKRRHAGDQKVQRAAERVDVDALVDGLAARLLGRDVVGRADDDAHRGQRRLGARIDRLGEPEVGDLHAPVAEPHQVRRLDVAVDEARLRGGREPLRGVEDRVRRLERAQGPVFSTVVPRSTPSSSSIAMYGRSSNVPVANTWTTLGWLIAATARPSRTKRL